MNTRTEGWSRLDALIAEDGEEGVLARVMTRIAIGDDPRDIALGMGMPWYVLRKWLEDKQERMQAWELAKRCFADGLVYESLKEARDADINTVQVAKLRSDVYSKTAGKVSREEWGDKVQMEVKQTHSVDIKNLLELREARLMALDVPVVVQAQPMPVVQQVVEVQEV